jgi:hypothetical protein
LTKILAFMALGLLVVIGSTHPASAVPITFTASLSGPAENPPNASAGTGFTVVTYDADLHSLRVQATFSNLTGNTTASHIHCCIAPPGIAIPATQVPSFSGFPLGVTAGVFDNTFDLTLESSWNPEFITSNGGTPTSAEAAFAGGLFAGTTYLNIHTNIFPGGEIRGFLAAVPEPSAAALLALGVTVTAMLAARWRRLVVRR